MRMRLILAVLASHWRQHPLQIVALLVGLVVSTALWAGVQALNFEARASYDRAARMLSANEQASVESRDGRPFPLGDYIALRRAGWSVSPLLDGEIVVGATRLRVLGIDPVTLSAAAEMPSLAASDEVIVDFLTPPHVGLVAPNEVGRLSELPDLPRLIGEDFVAPATLVVDIGLAEKLLDLEGVVSRLVLAPDEIAQRTLPQGMAQRLIVRPPQDSNNLDRLTEAFHLNLSAFGFLSFFVGLFIVYSAIGLVFEQRRPMVRTMRACGASSTEVSAAIVLELALLAIVGGLAGMVAGYFLAAALLPDVAASLSGLYGAPLAGRLTLSPTWWLSGLGMALLGTFAAASGNVWRTWSMPVLAPVQPNAWLQAQRKQFRTQCIVALVCGVIGAGVLALVEGLLAGFIVLAAFLIAAVLLLPTFLTGMLRYGTAHARTPLAQWAWADSRQQLGSLSLALMALLLALSVNVGVGTMVSSFRLTFEGWLDKRLAAEIYVTADDDAEARRISDWLRNRGDVRAVLPIWRTEIRINDWPTEIYGFLDHSTYRDNWPLLDKQGEPWKAVSDQDAVLVSEQMARRMGLDAGDQIEVPTSGGPRTWRIAGVYSDYGNTDHQIMMSTDALTTYWPEADQQRLAVRVAPQDASGLIDDLRATFALTERQVVDQAALKRLSRSIFEQTFSVTVALNALTLAIAGIALFMSLIALADQRLIQAAPLWAMGVARRKLAVIEILKTLSLAALTSILSLPIGLTIAWLLTSVVNVRAFGWKLPVVLFPMQWLALLAAALVTALVAGAVPALRLRSVTPLQLLKGFSNER